MEGMTWETAWPESWFALTMAIAPIGTKPRNETVAPAPEQPEPVAPLQRDSANRSEAPLRPHHQVPNTIVLPV